MWGQSSRGELGWNVCPWVGVTERHGGWAVQVNKKTDFGWRSGDSIGFHVATLAWLERRKLCSLGVWTKALVSLEALPSDIPRLRMMDVMGKPTPCGFVFIYSFCGGLWRCRHVFGFYFNHLHYKSIKAESIKE